MEEIDDPLSPPPTKIVKEPPLVPEANEDQSSTRNVAIPKSSNIVFGQHRPSIPKSAGSEEYSQQIVQMGSRSPIDIKVWKLKSLRQMFSVVEPS